MIAVRIYLMALLLLFVVSLYAEYARGALFRFLSYLFGAAIAGREFFVFDDDSRRRA